VGGALASWLLPSSLEQAVWIQALARDTVLCSWPRQMTLTVPLSTQANCCGNITNYGGVTCDGLASCPGGEEILIAHSCYIETMIISGSYEPLP